MSLRAFAYRKGEVKEMPLEDFQRHEGYIAWISALKPEKAELDRIFSMFSLHPLVIEDILNKSEPPKVEEYAEYTFIITDIPETADNEVTIKKLYLVLGRDHLVSISDNWDIIRKVETALINRQDALDEHGPDFLAYTLVDRATDQFYPALDEIEDLVVALEDEVLERADREMLSKMTDLRRGLLTLRKSAWRIREIITCLGRGSSPFIQPATLIYVRDIYDHVTQVMDLIETYRDILIESRDIYMSAVSVSLNQIMKQLTIIATIMLPLTFIVGVYGMNFRYMPELQWEYGYYAIWGVIILITTGMLIYFRLKKWI